MHFIKKIAFKLPVFFLSLQFMPAVAQNINIELGPNKVALNQYYTIKVVVQNDRIREYSEFPDIEGFVKQGTSSSSSTNIVNGQISSTQSIIQNYAPTNKGTYTLEPFKMEINGTTVGSSGTTITVTEPSQQRPQANDPWMSDPFQDFFGRPDPQDFVDVEADAFFALSTNKEKVYVGEALLTTLAFYVAESNKADLQFYEISRQISDILKEIKPENCWEENFNIDKINGKIVTINNKRYTQFKLYQANFYPLNLEDIRFPSMGLKMIKYKVARNPGFFGRNRQEDFKTFYSKEKTIKVMPLPPHPLRNQVAVGDYRLNEDISSENLETGKSFSYTFNVIGRGNVSSIEGPSVPETDDFDFYPPNMRQNINRANNMVTGSKSFTYYGIPQEPGDFDLKNYFRWIYFDPDRETYDTLRSNVTVNVTGESKRNEVIMANDLGAFYEVIELENNQLVNLNGDNLQKIIANILIILMLVVTAFIIFKK